MVYNWNAAKSYQANDYSVTGMVSPKRRYIIPYSLLCSELKTALKKSEIFFFFFKGDIQGAMEVYDLGT